MKTTSARKWQKKSNVKRNVWSLPGNCNRRRWWRWNCCTGSMVTGSGDDEDDQRWVFFFWFFSAFFFWNDEALCSSPLRLSLPFSFCFSLLYSSLSSSWCGCWDEEDNELMMALAMLVRLSWRMAAVLGVAIGMKKMMSWRWRWQCWCGCDGEWQRFFPYFKQAPPCFYIFPVFFFSVTFCIFF